MSSGHYAFRDLIIWSLDQGRKYFNENKLEVLVNVNQLRKSKVYLYPVCTIQHSTRSITHFEIDTMTRGKRETYSNSDVTKVSCWNKPDNMWCLGDVKRLNQRQDTQKVHMLRHTTADLSSARTCCVLFDARRYRYTESFLFEYSKRSTHQPFKNRKNNQACSTLSISGKSSTNKQGARVGRFRRN